MARSDLLQDPWYSSAGFSRGQYLGITKLAFNPKNNSEMIYTERESTQSRNITPESRNCTIWR